MGVKLLVLIAVLFVSCESLQVPVTCDGVHQYFPDPLDCGKFYECNSSPESTPSHMTCPSGLHWNSQINACDWPAHANCQLSGFCCYGCGGVCSAELVEDPNECSSTCNPQQCAPWCGTAGPAECAGSERPPSHQCCDVTGECNGKCDPASNPTLNDATDMSTPFSGTVHDLPCTSPTSDSSTELKNISYVGRAHRTMWDYRVEDWIHVEAFVFEVFYADNEGVPLEVRVNPEFGAEAAARVEAMRYSEIIGQIPKEFRVRLQILDLNKGTWSDGGRGGGNYGRKSMNLNTGCGEDMIQKGTIINFFLHEGSHVSIDHLHKDKPEWICAQNDDGKFISSYARDNPSREDIAESITAWYLATFHPHNVAKENLEKIAETIPHRLKYFSEHIKIEQ